MNASPQTFALTSAQEATRFEAFLHQYICSRNPPLGGIIPAKLISRLHSHCTKDSNQRLFYAILDLELSWLFMLKNSLTPAALWNQVLSNHRDDPKSILDDFPTFCTRIEILDSFNSMSLRMRACWDKYMGALILFHDPDKYDTFVDASSRKKTFAKIASEWKAAVSPHILHAITTVFRNQLAYTRKELAGTLAKEQMEAIVKGIDYLAKNELDYPEPAVNIMTQHIGAVDDIRTPEAHGAGMLRKWSLSSLPPNQSRDFALYNQSNNFSCYMKGLHESLLEVMGCDGM